MSLDEGGTAGAPDLLTPDDAFPPLAARRNFSWSALGNATYAISQWAVVIVLAQLGTASDVGWFALGLAITAPIVLLSGLQLRAVYATDARARFEFGEYLTLRLMTTAAAMFVIVVVATTIGSSSDVVTVIVMVGVAKAFEGVSDAFYGVMQRRERMDRLSMSLMLRGLGSLIVVAASMSVTGDVVVAAAGYASAGAIVLFAFDIPVARQLLGLTRHVSAMPTRPGPETLKLAKTAFPLGIVMFLISVNVNIPRYFVEGALGSTSLGYFAAIGYLYVGGNTLMVAVGESVAPKMSRLYLSDRLQYRRLLGRLVLLAAAVGAGAIAVAWLFGTPLLRLLYGPAYAERADVLVWLMASAALGFVSSMLSFGLTAARAFVIQVPLFMSVAVATLGLSWILIPRFGLHGAAYALLAAAALQLALTTAAYREAAGRASSP